MKPTFGEPEFDGYAIPEPEGDWNYNLDDHGMSYGLGPWPFYYHVPQRGGGKDKLEPFSIRLAPDTDYQSWRTQYVLCGMVDERHASADIEIYLRPQGMGGYVCKASILFDLAALKLTEFIGHEPERARFEAKLEKVFAFLRHARAERDAGAARPVTAHELWVKLKAK